MDYPIRQLSAEDFPQKLEHIPEPPEQLFVRGTLPSPTTKILAVVGSRALSRYGKDSCEKLIRELSGYDISIASGLALGTDACAHEAALTYGLHTLALPGSAISDSAIAPRSNLSLAHKILASGGALMCENDEGYIVGKYSFPKRNRLMAGIADAVLLIEAGLKSGTGITARLAMDYNRELLCVPHRIGDANSEGVHYYIRQGATLVTSGADILQALGIEKKEEERTPSLLLNELELSIVHYLQHPKRQDEILRDLTSSHADILSALASLELRDVVVIEFGQYRLK
jgi:DNA processing protein